MDFLLNKSNVHYKKGPRIVGARYLILIDVTLRTWGWPFFQSTMTFRSGRKDTSREECDKLDPEQFPVNVDQLANIFR